MRLFDPDRWQEVMQALLANRFRTGITAVSVAWGIFMLVLLLGMGRGLENNMAWQFRDDAVNSLWIYRGRTSIPWRGHPVGRYVRFTNRDYDIIRDNIDGIEHITGRFYPPGDFTIRYGERVSSFRVRSVHPGHQHLERTLVVSGRFLNPLDLEQQRKVAVIGQKVSEFLFEGADPLGTWIDISGIRYRVIGVFEDAGGEGEMRQVYIPISTAQVAYGGGEDVHQIMFTVGTASVAESLAIGDSVKRLLADRHDFSPDDERAVRVRNNMERFEEIQTVFLYLRSFIWLVGIGTITAGVVGVSNIMLVSVRERTREIGLRKALGATPAGLIGQILQEAVTLTAVSGYIGLVAGLGLIEGLRRFLPENEYIRDPQVDLGTVVAATVLLVICGAIAGFFPARRAALVNPIVALRDE